MVWHANLKLVKTPAVIVASGRLKICFFSEVYTVSYFNCHKMYFHILLYSNLLALYVFLAIHVLLSLTLILWKLIPLSFIYNSLLPLTFFKQLQDAAANSFFFFHVNSSTWLSNITWGINGEEVQGRLLPKSHDAGKSFSGPRSLKTIVSVWISS